jgi:hypothetical protein
VSVYLDTEFTRSGPILLGAPLELLDECMPHIIDANEQPHRAGEHEAKVCETCRQAFADALFTAQEADVAADMLIAFGWWLALRESSEVRRG